jgi:uncharacterized protein (PEP-CTERM system associated)
MAMDTAMRSKVFIRMPLATMLLLSSATGAWAQQSGGGTPPPLSMGTVSSAGSLQGAGSGSGPDGGRAWSIRPRISMTMTATDNSRVGGGTRGESDLITQLAPGIRIEGRTTRLRGFFDYSLRGQHYLNDSQSRTQNSLNALGTLEAIDDWLFIEASGIISQQSISAFGTQANDSLRNSNSTETATYRLSPYIRGKLGNVVDYNLRYSASTTRASASNASDVDMGQWLGRLVGSTPFHDLKWSVDASSQSTDYSKGRKTDADLIRAIANYAITPQFRLSASTGWESNNYMSLDKESRSNHGYGFDWNPTPRTQISAFKESRFFGDGHRFSFNHRFPMSSIRYSDSKDVSVLPNQFATVGLGSIYDLYFEQFATQIPDPVTRAAFVNALLAASGIDPNQQVVSGFLSSRASVQRQQQLAYVLYGARNSLTLQLNRSESSALLAAAIDDFSQSTTIRQRGMTISLSHRLSPLSSLNASANRQQSTGQGTGSNLKTTTTAYVVSASTKLGAKTTGSLSLRHTAFDNNTDPYTENALLGTITYTY